MRGNDLQVLELKSKIRSWNIGFDNNDDSNNKDDSNDSNDDDNGNNIGFAVTTISHVWIIVLKCMFLKNI